MVNGLQLTMHLLNKYVCVYVCLYHECVKVINNFFKFSSAVTRWYDFVRNADVHHRSEQPVLSATVQS